MTNPVAIRLARPIDRSQLIEVQRHAPLAGETGDVLRRLVEEPEHIDVDEQLLANNAVVLAETGGAIVGFASFIPWGDEAELDGMFVEPPHWYRGIGRMLIEALEREIAAVPATLLRVVANPNALDFYRAVGFRIVGEDERRWDLSPL